MLAKLNVAAVLAASLSAVSAQTYQRLGTCPTLGCLLPPDQSDFLPGQLFDLRVEVHAPVNGSEAAHDGKPDEKFKVTIAKDGKEAKDITNFFGVKEPELEKWTFKWYEDLFAEDKKTPSIVNVASKAYRKLSLDEPGKYTVTLQYYGGEKTTAEWVVRPIVKKRKAKNVIFFIGDGMTTNMITAARLLGHKSINGKYQTRMQMDEFPVLGHQMTHSIDSYITDSANSASALYSGHKSTVNAMGVHADSSPDPFDDPKVETIVEIFRRITKGAWGAVSTAFLADATPIALTGHTRRRSEYGPLIDQALNGLTNYSWTNHEGPDVFFGAGAEQFFAGKGSYKGKDYYEEFSKKGYSVSLNKTSLEKIDTSKKALGVFCQSNLPVWLDRNVYKDNLKNFKNNPKGGNDSALDLPGLKEMTLKAVEVLHKRGGDKGFFLMSEAASVDKQMHALDYDRALGDLLELDDTVRETIKKLKELKIFDETLVVVSADHGHGFDVWGSADTEYIAEHDDERTKRNAIGVYEKSGLSQYTEKNKNIQYGTGVNFPSNWEPRYAIAGGVGAAPDHREDYKVHKSGPREPAVKGADGSYIVNAKDSPNGIVINGTLPTNEAQGVHSLTDVPVFAMGPCQETFGGTYNNVDIFYKMATCLGLARPNTECKKPKKE
ncbi:alkaline phosphatase [Metarhizium robertsii]|uniref:alkaline phosphatase n=2 Tax=Metarhizium robertsii TaxID=568076 RepID=E9F4X8_METRA|nr:alkaline phosphatase [Metarhizium robertsii ARSEF 23]EFY97310.1 alkaline phosphatase [Metarhizium robertsii ARSEF 23]EXV00787.1 alkaline phosphatase [Metarhizium robertsii]